MSDNNVNTTTATKNVSQNQDEIVDITPKTEQVQLFTLQQMNDFIVTKIHELKDTDPRLTKDPKLVPEDSVSENRSGEGKSSTG